ncbi:MAG: hypothetical protein ACQETL_17790 [Bacteroidota bacterium]
MKTHTLFLTLSIAFFLNSCELVNNNKDDMAPIATMIQPKSGETYYNTGKGFDLIMKLSDPEQNGRILQVNGNGSMEFNINEEAYFYDETPDTIGNIASILYGDFITGETYISLQIEDAGGNHSLGDLEFIYKLDDATLKNISLEKFGVQGADGSWPVKASFDIQMASGDLGSVIGFTISNQDWEECFGGFTATSSYIFDFNCNTCGENYEPLTSNFEADITGKTGEEFFLYVKLHNYSNNGGAHCLKYSLGVIT